MLCAYVLQSIKDGKLYIGYNENLRQKTAEHNEGMAEATKYRVPLKLIYYEACLDKNLELSREKFFKSGFGRRFLKNRLLLEIEK